MANTNIDTSALSSIGLKTPPARKNKTELGQEAFLKLLTTQLQNQDPTKPLESGEFLTQIAQFGTVTGIQDLQKSFAQLAQAMSSNQGLQAASLVGKQVLLPGERRLAGAGSGISGAVDVTASGPVGVRIYDSKGQIVTTIDLGIQNTGRVRFDWDGRDAAGNPVAQGEYRVEAFTVTGGKTEALKTYISGKVGSVVLGGSGSETKVNVDGIGSVAFSKVAEIR